MPAVLIARRVSWNDVEQEADHCRAITPSDRRYVASVPRLLIIASRDFPVDNLYEETEMTRLGQTRQMLSTDLSNLWIE